MARVSVFFSLFDRERWMVRKKNKVEKGTEAERRPEKNDSPVGKGWKLSEVPAHRLSTRRKHIQLVLVITCSLSLPSSNTILGHACHRSPVFLYSRHTQTRTRSLHHPPPCLRDLSTPLEDNEKETVSLLEHVRQIQHQQPRRPQIHPSSPAHLISAVKRRREAMGQKVLQRLEIVIKRGNQGGGEEGGEEPCKGEK